MLFSQLLISLSLVSASPVSTWHESLEKQWEFCVAISFESPICPQLTSLYSVPPSPSGQLSSVSLLQALTSYRLGKDAIEWLEQQKLGGMKPASVDSALWNQARWLYAQSLYDHGRYKESSKIFDELNDVFKGRASFHQQRAWAQYFAGDAKRALGSIISAESPLIREAPFVRKYFLRALVERDLCQYQRAFETIAAGREALSKLNSMSEKNIWVQICERKGPSHLCGRVKEWYQRTFAQEVKEAQVDLDTLETEMNEKGLSAQASLAKSEKKIIQWPFAGEAWEDELGHYEVQVEGRCSQN